jgi:beta-galactosidase
MSEIEIKNGSFIISGKPEIIHAAEFHYFRIPADQWESRLKLLKQTGFNTLATYIPWLWHEIKEGEFDFDGKTHPMRNLSGFLDLASQLGLWIIARPGPYIMAETINEGIPKWVFSSYPEVCVIDQKGDHLHYLSYLHPQSKRLIQAWYKAVFQVLSPRQIDRSGQIIMIQLDNEIGMIAWVRNMIDLNPDNLERFTEFLKMTEKHEFSTAWVSEKLCNPDAENGRHILKTYSRYYREVISNYAQRLWEIAKGYGMTVLPVINIHGFGDQGRSFPIGLSQLFKAIRIEGMVCATDVYPLHIGEDNFHQLLLVNEMTKALQNKDQALFSIEFEAGGNGDFSGSQSSMTDLHTRLCLSSGMKAINHYLFMDGENCPEISPNKRHDWGHPVRKDGTFRSHYYRYPKLASMISAYGQALIKAQPVTMTTIGFQIDDYMTEYSNQIVRTENETLRHFRNAIQFDGMARFCAIEHLNFDAIEVQSGTLDPKDIPSLWMMIHDSCPRDVQQKLVQYVHQGGKLILIGHIPIMDENLDPCMILKDALTVRHIDQPKTDMIDAFEFTDIPVSLIQCVQGDFDHVFAQTKDREIVGFVKHFGQGSVVFLGAAVPTNTLDDLAVYRQICRLVHLKPALESFDWIDVREMTGPLGKFICLNNYSDDPWMDLITRKGKDLFNHHPIVIPARSGLVLPLDVMILPDLKLTYSTVELREIESHKKHIILHFSSEGYVKIESNTYLVDGLDVVDTDNHDLHLRGTTLTLIKKG